LKASRLVKDHYLEAFRLIQNHLESSMLVQEHLESFRHCFGSFWYLFRLFHEYLEAFGQL